MKSRPKAKKRQTKIDARNFVESRRTWQPDWEPIDRDMPRINREMRKKYGPPINE